jgi:hypothetical protein
MINVARDNWNSRSSEHYESDLSVYEEIIVDPEERFSRSLCAKFHAFRSMIGS